MVVYELIITIDGEPVRGLETFRSRDLDGAVDKAEELAERHPEMKVGIDLAKTDGQDCTTIASFRLEEGRDRTSLWDDIAGEMGRYKLYTIECKVGCTAKGADCAFETDAEAIEHAKRLMSADGAHGYVELAIMERGLLKKEDATLYAIMEILDEAVEPRRLCP